ncbi:sugar transferase [Mesorhizobium sp. CAU 1741]|uniref:sugar transferase n=1 Tax=Mesorhizobium sp. CAU 1741 TaxID=3140366 RepID=UPI00325BE3A1
MREHAQRSAVNLTGTSSNVVALQGTKSQQSKRSMVRQYPFASVGPAVEVRSRSQNGLPLYLGGDKPLLTIRNARLAASKRALDIAGSLLLILLFAPLMVMVAAAIKLSSKGPIIVAQEREGLNRARYKMMSFRTVPCEAGAQVVRHIYAGDSAHVTPLGKFLRATKMDDLPLLFNILRGDMSFVGPRPYAPQMRLSNLNFRNMPYEEIVPYFHLRHEVRPGLVGWAQANGYYVQATSASMALESIDHDVAYVQNASLALDLKIVLRTMAREFLTTVEP